MLVHGISKTRNKDVGLAHISSKKISKLLSSFQKYLNNKISFKLIPTFPTTINSNIF